MPRFRFLLPLLLALTAACSASGADLPDGAELLKRSAAAMREVRTVAFTIETEGSPPVPLQYAEGDLLRNGDAQGTLRVEVLGSLQELEFVLSGDTVHVKGPTGGYQKTSRAQLSRLYDPAAILDPDRGVAHLLGQATGARTEAAEQVGGRDAYRVAATLAKELLAPVVPGIAQEVTGRLWIDAATGRLLKADLPLGSGKVVVSLADHDAPVTVTPPAS